MVAAVPSAVVDDAAPPLAAMRRDLLTYFGLPFYRAMLERSGFGEDIAAYDEAAARGDGEAMQAAISDRFLHALCAIGSAGRCPRRPGAVHGRGRRSPVRGPDRQDRLRGHAARGGAASARRVAASSVAPAALAVPREGVGGGSGRWSSSSTGASCRAVSSPGARLRRATARGARHQRVGFARRGASFATALWRRKGGGLSSRRPMARWRAPPPLAAAGRCCETHCELRRDPAPGVRRGGQSGRAGASQRRRQRARAASARPPLVPSLE